MHAPLLYYRHCQTPIVLPITGIFKQQTKNRTKAHLISTFIVILM
jgi:hypothetical protein